MHSGFFCFLFISEDTPLCIIILINEWEVLVDTSAMEINNIINSF